MMPHAWRHGRACPTGIGYGLIPAEVPGGRHLNLLLRRKQTLCAVHRRWPSSNSSRFRGFDACNNKGVTRRRANSTRCGALSWEDRGSSRCPTIGDQQSFICSALGGTRGCFAWYADHVQRCRRRGPSWPRWSRFAGRSCRTWRARLAPRRWLTVATAYRRGEEDHRDQRPNWLHSSYSHYCRRVST
jgi:hypothetical protein